METKMFGELLASAEEMDQIVNGDKKPSRRMQSPEPEAKLIRERLGVSQGKFATILSVSKRTVENWEQDRRHPTGAARSLLKIVDADPKHALQVLTS